MAGDWISMRHDLADDPAVMRIATVCGIPRQHVVGCLHAVWSWFDRHTTDGRATGIDATFIDELAGVSGFGSALAKAGWLRITKRGISLPKFDRHISQSAKKRQLTARRVANHRQRKSNADCVTEASPQDNTAEHKREENRKKQDSASVPSVPRPFAQDRGQSKRGETVSLGSLTAGFCEDARKKSGRGKEEKVESRPVNTPADTAQIVILLSERGCDADLRNVVSRRAPFGIVQKAADQFDKMRGRIQNPGGWFRKHFRDAGVEGL